MTAFVLIAAAMVLAAVVVLTRPLWRRARPADSGVPTAADARAQIHHLEALQAGGTLTDAQAAEARARLEQRVGRTVTEAAMQPPALPARAKGTLSALTLFVVLVVVVGYTMLGTPQALDPAVRDARGAGDAGSHAITMEQIEGMIEKLVARLQEQPGDVEGWGMLGRSYAVLGRFPQAVASFKQAFALKPDDAMLLADYADALAMANGRNLEGEPSRLIARALELDPDNLKALSLAGSAAFVRKDYATALRHWQRMQAVAPDSEFTKQLQGGIEEARRLAAAVGQAVPAATAPAHSEAAAVNKQAAAGAESISGVVRLGTGLAGKAAPEDTLFVYARPAQGPRMPLAILRKQVKDLPLTFTLDDSMAMSSAARLSSAQLVVVSARISKTGNATPQPGDLLGQSAPVSPGTRGLTIEIGQVFSQ